MTIAIAMSQPVLESGVLPDLESPDDIAIIDAPVSQVPTEEPDARWGFVRRERRFPASRSLSNLTWATAIYAPGFGLTSEESERFILVLKGAATALGPDATPDELFVAVSNLIAPTATEPTDFEVMRDAWQDLWEYQAQGGRIFDTEQ